MSFPLAVVSGTAWRTSQCSMILPFVVEPEDVDAGHVQRLVVRVDGDQIALRDDPVNLDIDRSDRFEERLHRLSAAARLRVVLDVVLDDQVVEGVGVAGAKGVEEPVDRLLVLLCSGHRRSSSVVVTDSLQFPYTTKSAGISGTGTDPGAIVNGRGSLSPLLLLILIVLLIAAFGGGLFVHNLLWLLLVVALIALVVGLVSGRTTV